MDNVADYILSDEFCQYAAKITEIHSLKKSKSDELKQVYNKIKKEIEALETEAVQLTEAFEEWKSQKVSKPK
jgi:FtsZ-binding cell division protein ZapB